MIYFLHVPKTAGTSMRQLFASRIKPDAIKYIYLPPAGIELEHLFALPRRKTRNIELLFGHFHYGIDQKLGVPGKYVTCLRETASRLISNYHQHVRGGFTGSRSLLDYFLNCKPKDMDNYTVRLLAGVGHDTPFGGVTAEHLFLAQKNLRERFASFGLYEHLDESIERFRRVLGFSPVEIGHENVTPRAQKKYSFPAGEISVLLQHNRLDEELYAYAQDIFVRR